VNPDCLATLLTLLCNRPVMPGEWPSARIIHVPPGFVEPASPAARARWETECDPRKVRDRYGAARYVYAKAACEYGPDGN
jgi:hypothetical protein